MGRRLLAVAWLIAALMLAATLPASADKGGHGDDGDERRSDEGRGHDDHGGDDADDGGDGKDRKGRDGQEEKREKKDKERQERQDRKERRERDRDGEPDGDGGSQPSKGIRDREATDRDLPIPRLVLRQDVDSAGNSATYTLAVHNAGEAQAGAVAIEADLPAGTWSSPDPACQVVADHLSCALGPIAAGGHRVLEAQGTVTEPPFPVVVQAVTPLGDGDPSVP